MAITTLDHVLAALLAPERVFKASFTGEAAGQLHSSLYLAGRPGAGAAPSPGMAGAALTSYGGQIPFPPPAAGRNVYLARFGGNASGGIGAIYLMDRLWHQSGIDPTVTTAQTVNSVAWPARDQNGSTNGAGVEVALEVSTATTNGAAVTTITLSYTNSDNVSGRTATMASFPATAVAGTFVPFALAAGDVGVRSIQSIILGTSLVTGAVHLVAYRSASPELMIPSANIPDRLGPAECGMPRWYDQSVPWLAYMLTGTSGGQVVASVQWAQG